MFQLNFKLIVFTLTFLGVDLLSILLNPIKAEINNNNSINNQKILYSNDKNFNVSNYSINNSYDFKRYLKNDLIKYGNSLFNLIALKKDSDLIQSSLDIESDIQYRIEDVFYAEGNAVIYFSDAILKGDKLIYDTTKKTLRVIGDVVFVKGNQYFEASEVFYDLKNSKGSIDNIYGVLDMNSFTVDYEFKNIKEKIDIAEKKKVSNLEYIDSILIGLDNDFISNKKFNISNFKFDIPSIKKWRYKSSKIYLEDKILKSDKIFFTNDAINKPQLFLESKNFSVEVIDDKIKLISRQSWIILDDKLKFPIGKRTIFDSDPATSWGIGSDFKEKDGYYVTKPFGDIKLSDNFDLNLQPYFLLQRAVMGKTKVFTDPNQNLLSKKVSNDINFADIFALDKDLSGEIYSWNLNWNSRFNTFNPDRISQAIRTRVSLQKSFDLSSNKTRENNLSNFKENKKNYELYNQTNNNNKIINNTNNQTDDNNIIINNTNNQNDISENFLDLKFSSVFREKIKKLYAGDSEIYFGNKFSISNRRSRKIGNNERNFSMIYDFGKFKAKSIDANEFKNLYRNVFGVELGYKNQIWKKKSIDKNINADYKYIPSIINESINWITNIKSGLFLYSDGSSQKAISFSAGPELTFGSFKKNFLDYTYINIRGIYVIKKDESPFAFDNINKDFRLNMELKQQLIGPLVLSYNTNYNFEKGDFSKPNYGVEFNRRAYSIGGFYNTQNRSLGIRFNIFNFDYSGQTSKF